ncbi:LppP/LprE family lipoprotein [Gordonia sp. CPCC 205515]|uniref:LppP/LprE family lipoprotein n=1 Tax=Gordonia sp. CPCC 205515 TaxID=3140791 RepID=UPI003AF3E9FB
MRTFTRILACTIAAGTAVSLAACSSSTPEKPQPVTKTVTAPANSSATATAENDPTTTGEPNDGSAAGGVAAGDNSNADNSDSGTSSCSTDGTAAITAAAQQIAPPLPASTTESHWVYGGSTNYNTCNELSYAALDTDGATASSPMQLLLFHHGKFVGTGIKCNAGYQTVTGASPTSVDVNYHYLNEGDISARPTGNVDVAFVWDGSKVVMNGSLPAAMTRGQC